MRRYLPGPLVALALSVAGTHTFTNRWWAALFIGCVAVEVGR